MSSTFKPSQPDMVAGKRRDGPHMQAFAYNFLRDQFSISTWMSIGALGQLLVFALPLRPVYAAAPILIFLLWNALDFLSIYLGVKRNPVSASVIYGRTTAIAPDEDGRFSRSGVSGDRVSVFHLGFKNYHVLGPIAPGFGEFANYATSMFKELAKNAEENGFLGMDTYSQAGASTTGSHLVALMYFKSNADVHRYAEGPLHRKAWDWYNRFAKTHKHIGIMHELYEAPAGNWENVYVNIEPNGLGVTRHRVYGPDGATQWISPLVDANKGKLSTTHGRLD